VTSYAYFRFLFPEGNGARTRKKINAKTRKNVSVGQAFSHALVQVIAKGQLISQNESVMPIQMLMIPGLFNL
jgi:hypothetical protein